MPPLDIPRQEAAGAGGRWFALDTPLGKDVLVVARMVGEEGMSRLFHFEITAISERQSISPEELLGKAVTLEIGRGRGGSSATADRMPEPSGHPVRRPLSQEGGQGAEPARYLNGIVTRFRSSRILQGGLREFHIDVAPKAWVLQRTTRYRVYQNKTAKEIIVELLDQAGVLYKDNLTLTYDPREYCIQYGETDFQFMGRLMGEEGIFYYFKHSSGEHKLVLEDSKTWSSGRATDVQYRPTDVLQYDVIKTFDYGPALIDRTFLATDYDFKNPDTAIKDQTTTDKTPSASMSWQHHVHGVRLPTNASVKRAADIGVAKGEGDYETGRGEGTDSRFVPGFVFEVKEHADAALADRKFVLIAVHHDAFEPDLTPFTVGTPRTAAYRNEFSCVPAQVLLSQSVPPQKPLARGPMTGLVVGPSGSEIHTDEYGRIRVQFYWDQDGQKDDKSSCFIRVAQPWSGKNWGAVFIPRVGMEVVVQFIDGDPDRPLVTGTVYNGLNKPPWALPDKMTKSGILTRSTKDGAVADANELSFDDDKGKEVFLLHAQRDLLREVENDEKITVEHDQITEVKNDRTTTIKEGNDTLTVKTGNQTHEVTQGNRSHTIKTGNDTLEVSTGNRSVTVKTGNHDLKLNTGNVGVKCDVGQIKMDATTGITLVCGQSKVELTPTGITLSGVTISIKGTAMLEEKAPIVTVKGDGMTTIEGGLVKIN